MLPAHVAEAAKDNIGAALAIAADLPGGEALATAARDAFVDGMRLSMLVGAAVFLTAAAVVARFFPNDQTTEATTAGA